MNIAKHPQTFATHTSTMTHVLAPLATPDASNPRAVKDPLRYKTQLCANFQRDGACRYGRRCQFAHGVHELRERSQLLAPIVPEDQKICQPFAATGFCRFGDKCKFPHVLGSRVLATPPLPPTMLQMCPPVQQYGAPTPPVQQYVPTIPVQQYGAPSTPPAPAYRVPVSTPPAPPAPTTSRRSVSFAAAMCAPCDDEGDMIVLSDLEHFAADSDEETSGDLDADIPFITKKGRQLTDTSAVVRRALSFLLNDDE